MHKLFALYFLLISSISFSAEKTEFVQFFDRYQRLSSEFDTSVSKLYTDDAKIIGVRKKQDGTEEKMIIDGSRWKTIIVTSMENAKQHGDHSEYSNVAFEVENGQAKITATRYSTLSCFTDHRFYMVVKNSNDDQLQIIEQFMVTPAKSNCEDSGTDLPDFLQSTVKIINEQLPAAIDAETHLIQTSAEGTKLTYHYVLINYTSETLTTDKAAETLQPLVVQQSCSSPNLRSILDQNGSIAYIYKGSDAVQIAKFDIDITACPN